MKQHIETLIQTALKQLKASGELPEFPSIIQVDMTKDKQYGDFASNIAMVLAKSAQKKPRDISYRIIQSLPASAYLAKAEVAGPGFINFFLTKDAMTSVIPKILSEKSTYGKSKIGRGKRVLVEFLSANPNGPLHV